MHVPRLRRAGPVRRLGRQRVAFENDDMIEQGSERACGREAAHTRADDDRLLANQSHGRLPALAAIAGIVGSCPQPASEMCQQ